MTYLDSLFNELNMFGVLNLDSKLKFVFITNFYTFTLKNKYV